MQFIKNNTYTVYTGFSLITGNRLKKLATWRCETYNIWGSSAKQESESLKLPTALKYQAAYFYILAVYFKT